MGPPDPQEILSNTARDLAQLAGDLNRTKADASHWLTGPEYATLLHRLEGAHAAAEAALIEARRRVRLNEGR
jgi:hypothetical protein